jgi:hypothetical protein
MHKFFFTSGDFLFKFSVSEREGVDIFTFFDAKDEEIFVRKLIFNFLLISC